MTVLVAVIAGFLSGRLVWVMLRSALAHSTFERLNFRERMVPTAGGVVVPLALIGVEGGRVLLGAAGVGDAGLTTPRLAVLIGVVAFALLGLMDDLGAAGAERGFRGHLRAIGRGELTTGGAKLAAGGAVALVLAALLHSGAGALGLIRDAALVALAANMANLLDRAPGRVLKVTAVSFVALVAAAGTAAALGAVAVAIGAGLALALDDLHERVMLGDTGANALGAVLGVGAVAVMAPNARTGVLAVLVLANAASEVVSFSRVIDGFAPLRALDRAGRRA